MKKLMVMAALAAGAITPARAVDYYDPSDRTVKASPNATTLTTQTLLSGGWYVVPVGTTTINDRIIVSNNVNLVLCDGATLNANSGITVAGGNSLTIWGQGGEHAVSGTSATTRGTGTLFAQTSGQTAAIGGETSGTSTGDIVINGGVITAHGSWGAGIGRGNVAGGAVGSVTINEGHVTASGNSGSAGIGSGAYANSCPVTISGGYVVATGGVYDGSGQATPGIGTGRPRVNGSEPLSNGTITIIGGTVIAEAGTPPSGGTAAQAIGVNVVDADHNGTSHLVLGDVRAYAFASATTPVAVSARGNTCRGTWVKLETCTSHSDANSDSFCDYCGGYCGPLPPTGPDGALVISTVSDWNAFATGVNVGGEPIQGWTVRLAADVGPVSTPVGTSDHPFAGTFNGNGHTLTIAIDSAEQWAAPFSCISGATISNLVVTGTVSGGFHSAGLVGFCGATGPNIIRDCTVSVAVSGTAYLGGIVGHGGSGTLTLDGCVFSGAVNGFTICAGGLMGWCDALTLTISNCLCTGAFTPSENGKYHPVACRFANRDVSATVSGAYYLNSIVPTVPGVNPDLARSNLIPGAIGIPVSTNLVAGEWSQPVTAADGNTYYSWVYDPAGRLIARYSFDDAGNGGLNLLHADFGQDAIVRATTNTVVAGIGAIAAVTDSSILSGLAAGDGAVAIPNGQHLAVPIPAALLSTAGLPYTVVMRIRVPDEVGWRSLVNMPASNDTDAMIYLQRTTRNLYLKQYSKVSGEGVAAANGFVAADQWTTLTFAFDEYATDVYLDGRAVLHATGALAGSYADCVASGGYILVGADDSYDDDLFYLSEFRIYAGSISPPTLSGNGPDNCLDACLGEQGAVHVAGWAFDPDAPSQSLDIHVSLFTDPDCTNQYGDVRVLKANVPRPDVNNAKGITGNHGFDAQIPVSDIGTYWVKVVAVDATGDDNRQVGATARATVTAPDCTVTVTKFNQSYPYSGKATVEYTIDGPLPSNAVAQIVLRTDDATATFVQSNIVAGANTHEIDFASSFGDALWLTNASFVVTISSEEGEAQLGGVQLWENGPYWAECNVGAAAPEEYGYYFWWGDTVGYRRENDAWVASDGSSSGFSFKRGNTPTYYKDNVELLAERWIDSTGNLTAVHDAATMHLGSPWRMPTDAEFVALTNNCTFAWITTNGVSGRLVTGKGDYADRSIFLPAAGDGGGVGLFALGSWGHYWSSTPDLGLACYLYFNWDSIHRDSAFRDRGWSVRPVRRASTCRADGTVTYDPPQYSVEVTKFHQSYPYSGRATIEYTVSWPFPADAVAQIVLRTDDATATFVQSNVIAGANSNVIDFASSFGGALLLTNASFVVTIARDLGGVQLCGADGTVTYEFVTETTPIPVPYAWLEGYPDLLAGQSGDHEAAAHATAANGRKVWACYVAGLDPSDPLDDFRITRFWMDGNMPMFEFNHTTDGSGRSILPYIQPLGKVRLDDGWRHVPDGGKPTFRFFAAEVVPPGCESVVVELGGVQLWADGPYWAECNVGATSPEESGYYFWWGDTVGYRRENDAWVASDGSTSGFSFESGNVPTYGKDNEALLSEGWIGSTGNLAAAHDAATAHLGAPWRMPTDAEFAALTNNCTTTWITTNGVSGRLVTGKGAFADRSIFLPAAGYGYGSGLWDLGYWSHYWSSTPDSDNSGCTWFLDFSADNIERFSDFRDGGWPVRHVRDPDD